MTPPDELIVDVLFSAFVRMLEDQGERTASAPGVRIVNLSIGDPRRVFARRVSPVARLLDWLAWHYNLVIVVSAGNHADDIVLPAGTIDDPDALEREAQGALRDKARHLRLLSPAEGINVLTVGALHLDSSAMPVSDVVVDLLPGGGLATYSARGGGSGRSMKPEVLMRGGRQLYRRSVSGDPHGERLSPIRQGATGPGLLVAAAAPGGGAIGTAFTVGTSAAAALTSRIAHRVLTTLEADAPDLDPLYHPVLTRALVVHGAGWQNHGHRLRSDLGMKGPEFSTYYGYGAIDPSRVATAARERAVVLGAGTIAIGERHGWRFPLPTEMSALREWRRLTVTLAWLSDVNPADQRYRMARLAVTTPYKQVGADHRDSDHYAVKRGTVQHEIFEGERAQAFMAGDELAVDVDCTIDAGTMADGVRYGLVVSLEVAPELIVDVHEEVRLALAATRVRVGQVRVDGR